MSKPVYVLGTGLSHDGSAVLLKDGEICVAIEKERITRNKHDGGNDTLAIQYCLDAEGITLDDLDLIVQCANFEIPDPERYQGKRLFRANQANLFTISHHLAHAYSAAGTCPFDECVIMVIDGAGSPYQQCIDIHAGVVAPDTLESLSKQKFWCEKDSFYFFDGHQLTPIFKDFSEFDTPRDSIFYHQTTKHSIGGFYSSISRYVFRDMDDVGKLMGLAPFGKPGRWSANAFEIKDGRVFVADSWQHFFDQPCRDNDDFKTNFQYYADVARWAQDNVELAVISCFEDRLNRFPHDNVCFSGGVALNAVANARLLNTNKIKKLYLEPAAGDNGIALGCAYYGWMVLLNKAKVPHDGNTCFGKTYNETEIFQAAKNSGLPFNTPQREKELLKEVAQLLAAGKTVAWFHDGSEFGPRALGHRSILAHPSIPGLKDHINHHIKFREDFRPFAPVILPEYANVYFESGRPSPYMILVDRTKKDVNPLLNVTHVDGTARVQTVDRRWNGRLSRLLEEFNICAGLPLLLNTSLNRKGMPIVETPEEAIALFKETALDVLVLGDVMFKKDLQLKTQKMADQIVDQEPIKRLKLPFEFDVSLMQADMQRIQDSTWVAHYNKADYDGDWTSLALCSKDGASSSIIADMNGESALKATEILDLCSYIPEVLEAFKFEKIAVRLMRLNTGAVIKPHRDNALSYEDGEFRLHVPIVTNPDVNFILDGERVVMNEGTCWYINANEEHSVSNNGITDRIHLVIDGKRNEWTDGIFFALAAESSFEPVQKKMSFKEQELMIEELRRMNTPAALNIIAQLTGTDPG